MNYQLIHNQIIERAQHRVPAGYTERHHIIPKCMGGTNDCHNLVRLTAREHFIVHKLLVEIYPNEGCLKTAVWMMATCRNEKRNYCIGAREYNRLRENFSIVQSATKKKYYKDPINRANQSAIVKKSYEDPVYRAKIAAAGQERFKNPAERIKMSVAQKKSWADSDKRANASASAKKRFKYTTDGAKHAAAMKKHFEDPDYRTKHIAAMKKAWKDNPVSRANASANAKGRKFVHNGSGKNRAVREPELSELLNNGWKLGRKLKLTIKQV